MIIPGYRGRSLAGSFRPEAVSRLVHFSVWCRLIRAIQGPRPEPQQSPAPAVEHRLPRRAASLTEPVTRLRGYRSISTKDRFSVPRQACVDPKQSFFR